MDGTDRAIVGALQADARLSYRDLGRAVGLSANAAAERVRRLTEGGVIRFRAEVDHAALGQRLAAFIDLRLQPGVRADDFERSLRDLEGVHSATLTTGSFDYTLRVTCADEAALVDIIESLRERCGARETYSRVVLREVEFD
jgi:Lrp/AsnC family transcriptional regulator, leucine-responsive regulatory protein